jgi:hypothetical protein
MTQNWIEVRIESSVDSGELLDQLDDPAVTGPWQENGVIRLFWPADRWNPDVLQDIRRQCDGWLALEVTFPAVYDASPS